MPYCHLNDYPADIRERAARIRLACFDVDGTLTDGRLIFDSDGREAKAFHVHDGKGLVLLRQAGIAVALVTARASSVVERRAAELGIAGVHRHRATSWPACASSSPRALGIGLDEVAFMGDDLPDLRVMPHVGLAVAPANAHRWVTRTRALAHHAAGRRRRGARAVRPAAGRAGPCRSAAGPGPAARACRHELARRTHLAAAGRRGDQRLVGCGRSARPAPRRPSPAGSPDYVLQRLRADRAGRAGQGVVHAARAAAGARPGRDAPWTSQTPLFLIPDKDAADRTVGAWEVRSQTGWVSAGRRRVAAAGRRAAPIPAPAGGRALAMRTERTECFPAKPTAPRPT